MQKIYGILHQKFAQYYDSWVKNLCNIAIHNFTVRKFAKYYVRKFAKYYEISKYYIMQNSDSVENLRNIMV